MVEACEICRSAARRFGVSASVVMKWLSVCAPDGWSSTRPGRRRSRVGARWRVRVRAGPDRRETDMTLRAVEAELARRVVKAGPYVVWSFFKREGHAGEVEAASEDG